MMPRLDENSQENNNQLGSVDNEEGSTCSRKEILPGFTNVEEFIQKGFKKAMDATKMANALPNGHNWDLYSSYPSFQGIMDTEGRRILNIISMVLSHQGINANILRRDAEEKFDLIVEANDTILERVGCNLDELSGIRRNPEPVLFEAAVTRPTSGSWTNGEVTNTLTSSSSQQQTIRLLAARNIQRPQTKFKTKVDNSHNPFEPIIKDKPHSLKPLSVLLELTEEGERFSHPYEYELDRLNVPASHLRKTDPISYKTLEETPLVVIEKPGDINILMEDLSKYTEIAVDLEHHSYRSFQGFTCLMQISTRETDYILDTLELRSDLQCLNEIFTNPKVVKVFHGAECDIEWLQRDLGLYVVNMFDTHQAARALNFSQLSLAFLLRHFCKVTANKQYQLADWRMRPLPEELIAYAREDTHYLLYIYDMMKNALLDAGNGKTNLLMSVIQRCTEICKKRYEKPIFTEDSHLELYRRHKKLFDNRQMYAMRELYHWRDKIAREEDESFGYVLPNHMLLQISELLPREMQGILACCNPIPPLVRQHLASLHQIILKAREQPLVRPVAEAQPHVLPGVQTLLKINLESPLHCPHDLSKTPDFRDDLPTLIGSEKSFTTEMETPIKALNSSVSVFGQSDSENEEDPDSILESIPERLAQVKFVSPYERYRLVRPFIYQEELEAAQKASMVEEIQATEIKNEDSCLNTSVLKFKDEPPEDTVTSRKRRHQEVEQSENTVRSETVYSIDDDNINKKKKKKNPKAGKHDSTSEESQQRGMQDDIIAQGMSILESSKSLIRNISNQQRVGNMENFQDKNSSSQKKNAKKHKGQKMDEIISPKQFKAFDFSAVDFGKFQGGSRATGSVDTKPIKNKKGKSKFIGKMNKKSKTAAKRLI